MRFLQKKRIQYAPFGILFATISIILSILFFKTDIFGDIFKALEYKSLDMMFKARGSILPNPNLIIVKIDERELIDFGYPIPHNITAQAIYYLTEAGAKAIGIDLFLNKQADENFNNLLVYSAAHSNVFLAVGPYRPSGISDDEIDFYIDSLVHYKVNQWGVSIQPELKRYFHRSVTFAGKSFDELVEVSSGIGHVAILPDPFDGVQRRVPLFVEYAGKIYPSLGAVLAFEYLGIDYKKVNIVVKRNEVVYDFEGFQIPTSLKSELFVNYAGPDTIFRQVSLYKVIEAGLKGDKEFLSQFKNAIVIIGPTARSLGDLGPNPFSEKAPNVFIHANVFNTIVSQNFIRPVSWRVQILIMIVLTMIVGISGFITKFHNSLILTVAILVGYFAFSFLSFTQLLRWFYNAEPTLSILLCYISSVSFLTFRENKQKQQIKSMFEKYVDASVVEKLIENPELMALGGEERELTIMFSDIQGFTSMSEKLTPHELVTLLNELLDELSLIIFKNKGTIDKYIGDAIMAFWGAPVPDENHAYNACITALEMQEKLKELREKWRKLKRPEIKMRIGINTGRVIIGNMGSKVKFNYTVVGDDVNLASRLEGANKEYGTSIMIGEATYNKVKDKFIVRELDLLVVKGKTEPVRVYELIGLANDNLPENMKRFIEIYNAGLELYRAMEWDKAIEKFTQALEVNPNDYTCKLYIQRCLHFKETPPPLNWTGVFILQTK
ncbi:MAG: CHASE2 domain-containing protein [Candidatus Kryptonium sp.]|nr:CHASE2 domain-containing protein [Candidatus Kryptonium sp.]MCX7762459.1 CHASE2 domain-containing protein [Candidatus Kryptonium sp.]MDW8109581.1 CHASE2 domain-containing protein [Candidatus Kryptonium sp.]